MKEEKLDKLLNELAEKTIEPVRAALAEDIKQQIPQKLTGHKSGLNTINIIIDLRISKLAAAAVIIITTILCANLLSDRHTTSEGIYQDGKLLAKYLLGGKNAEKIDITDAGLMKYDYLVKQGRHVIYYGDIGPADRDTVLMQWKLSNGKYGVVLGDLRTKTVSAEKLIKLQARMLKKKAQ